MPHCRKYVRSLESVREARDKYEATRTDSSADTDDFTMNQLCILEAKLTLAKKLAAENSSHPVADIIPSLEQRVAALADAKSKIDVFSVSDIIMCVSFLGASAIWHFIGDLH